MSNDAFWWPDEAGSPFDAGRPRTAGDAAVPYLWKLHQVEYRQLAANLEELKGRVGQVEATLARGVLLLVANLAAVLATLVAAYFGA